MDTAEDIPEHNLVRLLQEHPAGLSSRRIGAILNKPAHVVMGWLVALQKEGKTKLKNGSLWQWTGPLPQAPVSGSRRPGTAAVSGITGTARLPDARKGIPHNTRWAAFRKLCLYYAECVRLEDRAKVYEYAEKENRRFLMLGHGIDWHAISSGAPVALSVPDQWSDFVRHISGQYVTWRGTSAFAKDLQRRGIRHVVASPRRPQTLGKVERFWGTLWRECLHPAVFIDLADAQARIGHFIDYYNYRRPHHGLDGLVPADRFFQLAPEVRKTLEARVDANALDLARNGLPKAPFYLTGQAGGRTFSVHAEGERVILSREGQARQEIDLVAPTAPPEMMPRPACSQGIVSSDDIGQEQPPPPGVSMLDEGMHKIVQSLNQPEDAQQEGAQS